MNTLLCPCGSALPYNNCCGIYIECRQLPSQPEALMRSRYTAYTQANIDYIVKTMQGKPAQNYNQQESFAWAKEVTWLKLDVLESDKVDQEATVGFVEFIASFIHDGKKQKIHERSEFHRINGQWLYVDGHPPQQPQSKMVNTRNKPCYCGSLKKYKNCHGKS